MTNKNAIFLMDLGFAQNGTARMQSVHVRKARGASPRIAGDGASAGAKFIVQCELEHGLPRKAFRERIVDALASHGELSEREYFLKHEAVFNDWLYGTRATPVWVMQVVVELMFGMLTDPCTTPKLRTVIRQYLPKVIEEVAGGKPLFDWLLNANERAQAVKKTGP